MSQVGVFTTLTIGEDSSCVTKTTKTDLYNTQARTILIQILIQPVQIGSPQHSKR